MRHRQAGRGAEGVRVGAGDPAEAGRRQPRRHRVPERPGGQPQQHRPPAERHRQAGRGAEGVRVGAGDPAEAGRRQPHRHRVPEPTWRRSHNNIGILLSDTGKPAEALKAYEAALAIRQKLADANPTVTGFQSDLADSHNNIGVLLANGKPAEALKAYEAALAIQRKLAREHPESPDFASDLGGTLNNIAMIDLDAKRFEEARVRLREAVEWQRKALASNPAHPNYRQFLANHLTNLITPARGLGDAEGVAEAERELAKLRDSDPAMVALDARLAAILKGDQQPKDNAERLRLAQRAYDKALHATAARLWAEALEADPKLGDDRQAQHRYNAACAAALAGSRQGKDDPPPDEAARAKLRKQALDWLKAELSAWKRVSMTIEPGNKERGRQDPGPLEGGHRPRRHPRRRGVGQATGTGARGVQAALGRRRWPPDQDGRPQIIRPHGLPRPWSPT